MKNILIPIVTGVITISLAIIGWVFNEWSKRNFDNKKIKEQRYTKMMENIQGFYDNTLNRPEQNEFLNQYRLCWLSCPDDVIKEINGFCSAPH